MNDPNSPQLHGWNQPPGNGYGGEMYPGLGDPFYFGPPAVVNPTVLPAQQAPAAKGSFSFGDVKGFVDRMGGIDGVLNGVGKFQKLFVTFQQMAPLFRIFMGKGATAAAASLKSQNGRRRGSGRRTTGSAKGRNHRHSTKRR